MAKKKSTGPVPEEGEVKRSWLEDARTVDRLLYALYAVCGLLLVIDPLIHKHGPFAIEHWFGFYGLYAFLACVAMVFAAKQLRRLLMRPEDYYDD